ncbi:hypothetical protein N7G274_002804 [Stereocaulon virgatum]|uniref:Uncharacterized protein n=1 Tax=Stereocaulon virgatum TaxID=373712 RepID=A0ABR4AGW8_9LECA
MVMEASVTFLKVHRVSGREAQISRSSMLYQELLLPQSVRRLTAQVFGGSSITTILASSKTSIQKVTPQRGAEEVLVRTDIGCPTRPTLPSALAGEENPTPARTTWVGLSLYAGSIDGNIHEIIFDDKDRSWSNGLIFPNTNVFDVATTYSTAKNAYFFALGRHQTMDIWRQNYDPSSNNNDNTWHLGPSRHDSIIGNVSMCGRNLRAFQSSSGITQVSNLTGSENPAAERWGVESNISNQPAISGSA